MMQHFYYNMRTATKTVIGHTPSQTGSPRVHIFHGSCRNKNELKLRNASMDVRYKNLHQV